MNDSRTDSSYNVEHQGLPTWCAFALGGIVTFLFVYIGIGRPASHELAALRRQMSTLEQSVWEVAGQKDTAQATNDLLALLSDQQGQLESARKTVEGIQQLHKQLLVESERVQSAMVAVSQLGALKDTLLLNADRAEQAANVMMVSEDLYYRLAESADTTELALDAASDLLSLRTELLNNGSKNMTARIALDELIDLRVTLDSESHEVAVAQDQMTELISLKDMVVSRTGDLAEAIETLELTSELGTRFHEAALSFDQIRHWMVEVVAMEPMLQRAKTSIEPILELSNLQRLEPQQLRQMARIVSQQCQAHLARKPGNEVLEVKTTFAPAALDGNAITE